ncbi:uncharacterized protein LOC114576303, partial [Exaiptasia diaphana]|uniref:Uncharacterized protein n=1 Tax=Exaiptasia diaphana TaxID=2652724 RepID=A0A913YTG5_EXADI
MDKCVISSNLNLIISGYGKGSKYGPWTACDQVCGHNGKQTRRLNCNSRKGCLGPRQEYRDCNSVNCPQPCSFDGILLQLLHSLNLNISVNNNHLVAAFSQVVEAMSDAGSSSDVTNDFLIKRIKYLL